MFVFRQLQRAENLPRRLRIFVKDAHLQNFLSFLKKTLDFPGGGRYNKTRSPARTPREYAPVAQLDRVSDYESEGRGFESLPAHQGHLRLQVTFLFISPAFTAFSTTAYVSKLSFSNEVPPLHRSWTPQQSPPVPFCGRQAGFAMQIYFSNSFATSCSSCLMGRCWGQTRSHWPQRMQSEAREPGPVWTSS